MTVIAYRDGVMAADTGAIFSGVVSAGHRKIVRGPDGTLAGASGQMVPASQWLDWIAGGERGAEPAPDRLNDGEESTFTALLVRPDGRVWMVEGGGRVEVTAPYHSLGAGMEAALGAMFSGASAEIAAKAAVYHTTGCGGEVVTVSIEGN